MVNLLPSEVENNGRLLRLSNVTDRIFSQQDVRKFHHAIEQKFRTPISQIQISLDLLLRRTKKQHFDDLSDLATHAIEGMSKIKSQMDDIFRYLKAPALASRGETFSLAALPDMLNVLSSTFNISPIQICMPDDLQQTKLALTQPAIELIFWELLENSKKYHPTLTPKIEISISQISAQAIQLLIQDDGIHLSPQQIANVWEPYMQGEKGFSGEAPGMGLGLPLVSSLVWQVGGSAGISNRANRPGVVVELTIPLAGADS